MDNKVNKVEVMLQEYKAAFTAIGFDASNKDILEVLTFLAKELLKTQVELNNLRQEMRCR